MRSYDPGMPGDVRARSIWVQGRLRQRAALLVHVRALAADGGLNPAPRVVAGQVPEGRNAANFDLAARPLTAHPRPLVVDKIDHVLDRRQRGNPPVTAAMARAVPLTGGRAARPGR